MLTKNAMMGIPKGHNLDMIVMKSIVMCWILAYHLQSDGVWG